MSRLFTTWCVCILFFFTANSQDTEKTSEEVVKLTQKVIEGATSEKEKVEAIHHWITNNIAYDVDKYLAHDYEDVDLDNILKSKKAICYGYAQLFDAMCKEGGVPSVTIHGYIKNFDVDPIDSFYLDQHSWNAVLLDSTWYLVDVTWDAGYIRNYKLSFISSIAFNVLNIPHLKSKYDPKFVSAPGTTYFLRSGEFFSTDHLPALPMWQLMEEEISIEEFRTDSTFFYLQSKEDNVLLNSNNRERMSYYRMSYADQLVQMGKKSYEFNHLNQYGISLSYYINARLNYQILLDYNSEDADEYQDVVDDLQQAALHADSMQFYLKHEYNSLNRNYRSKRAYQKNYNKIYNRYADKACKSASAYDKKIEALTDLIGREQDRLRSEQKRQESSKVFEDAEFKHKFEALDSFDKASYTDSVAAEFELQYATTVAAMEKFPELSRGFAECFERESIYLDSLQAHFLELFGYRLSGFDDFDYYIYGAKLMFQAKDSNLFYGEEMMVDSVKAYYKNTLELLKQFNKTTKEYMRALKELKRMQIKNSAIEKRYSDMIDKYTGLMSQSSRWSRGIQVELNSYNRSYKKISKQACKVLKVIEHEVQIEQDRSNYKARIRAQKRLAKQIEKDARKLLRKAERKVQKYY